MSHRKMRANGRGKTTSFAGIPRRLMEHEDYRSLSGAAVKLLMFLCYQYRGNNNGDLSATFEQVKEAGVARSKDTLSKSLGLLIARNLIVCTREGHFQKVGPRCSLYALTWQPIDECRGKQLEVPPSKVPIRPLSLPNG